MSSALLIEDVCKSYVTGPAGIRPRYRTLRDDIASWFSVARRGSNNDCIQAERFWALRNVSFDVAEGEVVGLIGRNGAGKSTLLKILSRVTRPTSGTARVRGRVGSLLEVGTGFHTELTGRENVFLYGAILGMTRREIRSKFDEIVAFSGIEPFLDMPTKRYSSGMTVRLGFSIAAHLDSEILLIDEALAVGDTDFRRKCTARIHQIARDGRTVVLVSHDLHAISTMAQRCHVLESGRCIFSGTTTDALRLYLAQLSGQQHLYNGNSTGRMPHITHVAIATSEGTGAQKHGAPAEIAVDVLMPSPLKTCLLSIYVINEAQRPVTVFRNPELLAADHTDGACRAICRIPVVRLCPGHYALAVELLDMHATLLDQVRNTCPFYVMPSGASKHYGWHERTAYIEDCDWSLERVPAPSRGRSECTSASQ